eukprot:g22813.t1
MNEHELRHNPNALSWELSIASFSLVRTLGDPEAEPLSFAVVAPRSFCLVGQMADKWGQLCGEERLRPSLKNLTEPGLRMGRVGLDAEPEQEQQRRRALLELVAAHVDSFDQAVSEGLARAVQVSASPEHVPSPWGKPSGTGGDNNMARAR